MDFFNQNFLNIVKNHYADFNGRARRREYWMYSLVYFIIAIAFNILGAIPKIGMLFLGVYGLLALAVLIPTLALAVRRLHDTGKSGWFFLLAFIPLANFYLLYLLVIEGTVGDNEYGADPKAGER